MAGHDLTLVPDRFVPGLVQWRCSCGDSGGGFAKEELAREWHSRHVADTTITTSAIETWRAPTRLINNKGEVAVVYSPDYGAGWSSWISGLDPMHPVIARLIHENRKDEITDDLMEQLGHPGAYLGGLEDAVIEWVPPGTAFLIEEYDGAEQIITQPSNIYRA